MKHTVEAYLQRQPTSVLKSLLADQAAEYPQSVLDLICSILQNRERMEAQYSMDKLKYCSTEKLIRLMESDRIWFDDLIATRTVYRNIMDVLAIRFKGHAVPVPPEAAARIKKKTDILFGNRS